MKNFAAVLILVSFIGMAAFGAIIINHSMMSHGGCIASVITGGDCPINQLAVFAHHLAALQVFSNSLPPVLGITLLLLLLCAPAVFLVFGGIYYSPPSPSLAYIKRNQDRKYFHKNPFLRWLALFEHSPSF